MDTKVTTPTGVRKETSKSPVSFSRTYTAEFQKEGTKTVEISQKVTTKSFYPSKKVASDLQNGLFDADEFGFAEQVFTSEESRMAWLPIPESMKDSEVAARIAADAAKGSTIYRTLSNCPILDENQKYAISSGLRDMDHFANSQVVRYPENDKTIADGTAGHIVKDVNGNPQYRRTFYWKTPHEDIDVRDASNVYMSQDIALELQGASSIVGQTIG